MFSGERGRRELIVPVLPVSGFDYFCSCGLQNSLQTVVLYCRVIHLK